MRITDLARRSLGLLRLLHARLTLGGRVSFHPVQNASPFIRVYAGRASKLILGKDTTLSHGVDLTAVDGGRIVIGDGVYLGPRCMLSAHAEVVIGDRCLLGPDVKLFDNNHEFDAKVGVVHGKHRSAPIRIGANCWLGANVVILEGVTVGDGSVIGAGCVVRRDIPPSSVVVQESGLQVVGIGARRE